MQTVSRRALLLALVVFLLLTAIHTWPLATGLDELSRENNDERLNTWALAWIAHQLPRDPLHLFDGNIFHPNGSTLAYSEPLLIPGVVSAPLRWAGASPVLTHNVMVVIGLVLTALAAFVLVTRWTRDTWTGLVTGSLLAFNTQLLTRLSHLQILHLFWLPLAVLALDKWIVERRPRHAVAVGACVLGAVLTSGYLGMFVTTALFAAFLVRREGWWGHRPIRTLVPMAAAAAVTLAVAVAILWPYQQLRREQGFVRPLDGGPTSVSAASRNYLSTAARVHHATWSATYYDTAAESLFPGVVALGLAGIALCTRERVAPRGVRRMLASVGVAGFVMSLGQATPVYGWAYRLLPPLQGMRAVERFGILVVFAVAALAGLGLARLRRQLPRWRNPVAVAVLAFVTLESFVGDFSDLRCVKTHKDLSNGLLARPKRHKLFQVTLALRLLPRDGAVNGHL